MISRSRSRAGGIVGLAAAAVAAATLVATSSAAPPGGILQPVGGGVLIAYASVECSFDGPARLPRLSCSTSARGFRAAMDRGRVAFLRGSTRLLTVTQRAGAAVYGDYLTDPSPRLIRLGAGASIGFLGTNIACATVANGLRCLAHAGGGLPGPCCGPNYGLQVGSYGFFLSPTRLQELRVVHTGVYEGSGPYPPAYRTVRSWHL